MTMEVKQLQRVFNYNGVSLPDIPGKTPDEIRQYYAGVYPELNNADVPVPEYTGDKVSYNFGRTTGVKG